MQDSVQQNLKCSVYGALKQLKATSSFIENRMHAYMLYEKIC